jgi:ribonucleoside-diphosphate reductase alpha chain
VVVQKYFRGIVGTPERERSVRQLISRVADTITGWGKKDGYFADDESARVLQRRAQAPARAAEDVVQLAGLVQRRHRGGAAVLGLLHQQRRGHDGVDPGLAKTEGMLFKYGSGTGTNLSPIRSSKELLQGGGTASGPVSFMRGFDAFAGVIKSGGKTRRAARWSSSTSTTPTSTSSSGASRRKRRRRGR